MLLAFVGDSVGRLFHRVMVALAQPPAASNRNLPPEFYKFPFY
jgi:hypothetical protein